MANTDKDILITPNIGSSNDPKIEFKGASSTVGPSTITATIYPLEGGTLSFDGSQGSLFSISNNLTSGSIFSVNPISGIPIIDINANRTIALNPYGGNTGIGLTNPSYKLDVNGIIRSTSHTIALNFSDATGIYNVNLGSGGIEGRGLVAGYSGGSYGGIGYNVRHTTTGGQWIAPGSDTSSYLLFTAGGFAFYGAAGGAAGRTLSYTTLSSISSGGNFTATGTVQGTRLISTVATGTAPLEVTSTTKVNNLNADLLDGENLVDGAATANTVVGRDSSGNVFANQFIGGTGSAIGSAGLVVNGTTDNNDSQLIIKKPSQSSFSILAWNGEIYLSSNLYYNDGSWVHSAPSGDTDNQLFNLSPGSGVKWYASNNSSGSWNVANNLTLWNDSGTWQRPLSNTLTLNTSGTGLSGSTTYNNSGAATFTVTSNATSDNTSSTIVARDANGNFSAGKVNTTQLVKTNARVNTSERYPVGHYSPGETVFEIDPTWSNDELREYFNSSAVSWTADSTAPGGYAIYIDGAVNVGGEYNSGFPYIPVDAGDIYYMECHIRNVGSNQGHYMGSMDYNESFTILGGNPGSYGYWVMSNTNPTTNWTKVSGYISGFGTATGTFKTGTKYWTPQALFNYNAGTGTRACIISGWKVIKVSHVGNRTFTGTITSTVATGTAPLTVSSTDLVSNLNADLLDGQQGSYYTTAGNLSGTIPSAVLGNSTVYVGTTAIALNRASADQTLTGVSIDGSANSADLIDGIAFRNSDSTSPITAPDSLDSNGIGYVNAGISFYNQSDGALYAQAYNSTWQHQIYGDYRTGQIAIRGKNSGTWQAWRRVLDNTSYSASNSWTPNYNGNTVPSFVPGTFTKSGGANSWNSQVYSTEGYITNVYVSCSAAQTNGHIMFGLNSDPTTDANYSSLDYAIYFTGGGNIEIYESNVQRSTHGTYATTDVFSVVYDGTHIIYYKNNTILRRVARAISTTKLYFDTSFFTPNSSITGVSYGTFENTPYVESSSKLYSTDASYAYSSANPYYGYLTYISGNNRWRFQVSPSTPAAVEVAYADNSGQLNGQTASYYLDTSATAQTKSGNLKVTAVSEAWAEGISVSLTSSSAWGGYRLRRERGGYDGNWAFGYTALDSTDDLVFVSNNSGSQVDNILRLTKNARIGVNNANPLQTLDVRGNFLLAADGTTSTHITQKPYTINNGTLSWEGSAGQLFSITNNLTSGSIFSVNDVSGIPSIDVDANGTILFAPYGGNIGVGTLTPAQKLHVVGSIIASSDIIINQSVISYSSSDNTAVVGSITANKLHVNGSIQLTGNNDAIVFGRGTSSFMKDEEIGFGWGGGWYMTDSTFLRVRGSKTLYNDYIIRSDFDVRAPIFRDQDDPTNYYVDPNGVSRVKGLVINSSVSGTGTLEQIGFWEVVDGVPNTTSAIGFKQVGGVWAEHGRTNGGYNTYFSMDSAGRGWVFRLVTGGGSNYTGTNVFSISNNAGETTIGSAWGTSNTHAILNVCGGQGSATTYRDIDLRGNWTGGEGHAITAIHGTSSSDIVGQMVFQHDGPGSRIKWGRLYHSGNQSTYPMELISESSTAYLSLSKNTASGLANSTFSVGKSIIGGLHFTNGSGTSGNGNQAAITFMGDSAIESQAGIYVHNNNSEGTHMALCTTDSYATGPQIGLRIMNSGYSLFPRSYVEASGSFRSPVFYDSNDPTNYYVDPAGTSNLATAIFTGNVTANAYYGDGSNLTGITAGATLSAASGSQRVVLTSLTSGTMTTAATDADLTFNASTNTLSSGVFTSTSDKNKKKNIRRIENATEILNEIRGVRFDWKSNNQPSVGVIAQEVEKVLPELVHTVDDGTKTVSYGNLVAVLIEALKEQQEQIDELKKAIKTHK